MGCLPSDTDKSNQSLRDTVHLISDTVCLPTHNTRIDSEGKLKTTGAITHSMFLAVNVTYSTCISRAGPNKFHNQQIRKYKSSSFFGHSRRPRMPNIGAEKIFSLWISKEILKLAWKNLVNNTKSIVQEHVIPVTAAAFFRELWSTKTQVSEWKL